MMYMPTHTVTGAYWFPHCMGWAAAFAMQVAHQAARGGLVAEVEQGDRGLNSSR